ncbi:hypothetical protein Bbelb_010050 [Branchiostoma belcheri]|nr:hypothetical protein Bbelb_010050 [Branchiostoma belcheri]
MPNIDAFNNSCVCKICRISGQLRSSSATTFTVTLQPVKHYNSRNSRTDVQSLKNSPLKLIPRLIGNNGSLFQRKALKIIKKGSTRGSICQITVHFRHVICNGEINGRFHGQPRCQPVFVKQRYLEGVLGVGGRNELVPRRFQQPAQFTAVKPLKLPGWLDIVTGAVVVSVPTGIRKARGKSGIQCKSSTELKNSVPTLEHKGQVSALGLMDEEEAP